MDDISREFERINLVSQEEKVKDKFCSAVKNIEKNRYKDVLALESTRVKLFVPPGCEGCDYINANHVNLSNKSYIASQAPLPWTIWDFWRMIWEQKSTVIVMLTKIVEGGRVKAHPYWPEYENETKRYGQFHITLLRVTTRDGIIKRQFQLEDKLLFDNNCRYVTQYHYAEWPDYGTPTSCQGILRLISCTNKAREKNCIINDGLSGPVVVHCSAGIGRAGTFIAIDLLLQELYQQKQPQQQQFRVMETLLKLRQQRKGMIQTVDQYRFVYKVLTEALMKLKNNNSANNNNNNRSTPPSPRTPTTPSSTNTTNNNTSVTVISNLPEQTNFMNTNYEFDATLPPLIHLSA